MVGALHFDQGMQHVFLHINEQRSVLLRFRLVSFLGVRTCVFVSVCVTVTQQLKQTSPGEVESNFYCLLHTRHIVIYASHDSSSLPGRKRPDLKSASAA